MMGFEITIGEWLLVCGLGVLVGLDSVSWPQAMWSRPVVAGTIGGLVFGAPVAGLVVGSWLELVMSRHPPYGAAKYPETGPAALTAGAAYGLADGGSLIGLVGAVLVGWTIGWVGMHSVAALRVLNARLVAEPASYAGSPRELARRHRLAIRLDGVRAGIIVGSLLVPSVLFVRLLDVLEPGRIGAWAAPVLAAMGLAGLTGIGARALGTRPDRWPAFIAGTVLGGLLVWWVP